MVLKLQGLLKMEFKEKKIPKDPNDLQPGDLGCDSRAPRKKRSQNEREGLVLSHATAALIFLLRTYWLIPTCIGSYWL